jgi:hypothetical protein
MKNALPLILYCGILGSALVFFALRREKNRNITITYSKQLTGDYYLYKKENKLVYVATKDQKNAWGHETIKPCIYELTTFKNFILAKSHPIIYGFDDSKAVNGLNKELYKGIKIDSTRTVYTMVDVSLNKTITLPEWALFEMELVKCSIPPGIQFMPIADK